MSNCTMASKAMCVVAPYPVKSEENCNYYMQDGHLCQTSLKKCQQLYRKR